MDVNVCIGVLCLGMYDSIRKFMLKAPTHLTYLTKMLFFAIVKILFLI